MMETRPGATHYDDAPWSASVADVETCTCQDREELYRLLRVSTINGQLRERHPSPHFTKYQFKLLLTPHFGQCIDATVNGILSDGYSVEPFLLAHSEVILTYTVHCVQ